MLLEVHQNNAAPPDSTIGNTDFGSVGQSGAPRSLGNQEAREQLRRGWWAETNLFKQKWIKKRVSWKASSASQPCQIVSQQGQSYLHLLWSYQRSTFSLKRNLLAKNTTDPESPPPPRQRQTTLLSLQRRHLDNSTWDTLPTAIAKWVASVCRLI